MDKPLRIRTLEAVRAGLLAEGKVSSMTLAEFLLARIAEGAEVAGVVTALKALDMDAMRATLRLLALPYAEHPDYREEWRP